jgi:hypothetical protein
MRVKAAPLQALDDGTLHQPVKPLERRERLAAPPALPPLELAEAAYFATTLRIVSSSY